MPAVPILDAERHWVCPSCHGTHITRLGVVHQPFHTCWALAGAWVPYIEDGVAAIHVVVERMDYVGDEEPWHNADGRPIMAVETRHADGSVDATMYVPPALVRGDEARELLEVR